MDLMPLDPDLLALLSHSATLARYTGDDQFGNNLYSAGVVIKTFGTEEVNTADAGDQQQDRKLDVPSRRFSFIVDALGIKVGDKITYEGRTGLVILATTYRDEVGTLFQTIEMTTKET